MIHIPPCSLSFPMSDVSSKLLPQEPQNNQESGELLCSSREGGLGWSCSNESLRGSLGWWGSGAGEFPGVCVCVLGDVLSAEGIGPYCPVSGCLTVYLTVSASLFPQGKVEYLVKWKGWPPK